MDITEPYTTPEEAQAIVRRGRRCFFVTVKVTAGWVGHDYAYSTRDEVTQAARLSMTVMGDAKLVVVFGRVAERVRIPAPQGLVRQARTT